MDVVKLIAAAIALSWAVPACADPADRWRPLVAESAARFRLPEAWVLRVLRAESGGRTHVRGRPIRSRKGAIGLMQLMPGTWAEMRRLHRLGDDPDDPRDNILAGAAYLRTMYDRFGYPGLFAAYNAGPARYARHLETGRPLPGETIGYLSTVAGVAPGGIATRQQSSVVGDSEVPPEVPAWRTLFLPLSTRRNTAEDE
ncbi:MAG: lytic transglycosylase domain-containing protein [Sphingomonas sp.]